MKFRKIDKDTVRTFYANDNVDKYKNEKSETRLARRRMKTKLVKS